MMEERRKYGVWVHWVGDAVSLLTMLITIAIGYGRMDARVEELAKAQKATDAARLELKEDVNKRVELIQRTLERIDDKLERLVIRGNK
jgi:hypothetical protein